MKDVKHFESLYPVSSREKELGRIVEYVKEGNSVQIISLPGVGRSNILGLLAYNRDVRLKHFPTKNSFVHFVVVNFSELHGRPLIDVTKLMFLNLLDSLRERDMHEEYAFANVIFRESLQVQDEFVLFQGLKRVVEYIGVEKKLTLIFLFDRFEEYVPMLSHAFFSNLRILRNLAKYRFSVIFTVYKPLEDILEPDLLADFYEFVAGHIIYLALYDEPSLAFRISYLEQLTGKKLSEAQKAELLRHTGGHWKLTKLGVEAVLASDSNSVILNDSEESGDPSTRSQADNLTQFLLSQKTIQGALREILTAFTPEEQKVLQEMVQHEKAPEDENVAKYFQQVGLVHEGKLAIPLLSPYLESQKETLALPKLHIFFDEEKNIIRHGDVVLSDGLTAAEYKLLAYLLRNPERVIERNELIDVVWQNEKSTAGVTDQAVDQLIFRIRRKIEDNPNKPEHLITVKGRGFEFRP